MMRSVCNSLAFGDFIPIKRFPVQVAVKGGLPSHRFQSLTESLKRER